jgi:hypothetical protein
MRVQRMNTGTIALILRKDRRVSSKDAKKRRRKEQKERGKKKRAVLGNQVHKILGLPDSVAVQSDSAFGARKRLHIAA